MQPSHKNPFISPALPWHAQNILSHNSSASDFSKFSKTNLFAKAKELYEAEVSAFSKSAAMSAKNHNFLSDMTKMGTSSDRIFALTLAIQSSPLHHFPQLQRLLDTAVGKQRKNRKESLQALEALQDLFISNILPDRKLEYFDQKLHKTSEKALLVAYYEDAVKKLFFEYIQALEMCFNLLSSKPEQEANLLMLIVNKLGDGERKISSKASYLLNQLLLKHPAMGLVVVKEVNQLIERPNVGRNAQYYAILFLSQIVLTRKQSELASKLVHIYLSLFSCLATSEEKNKNKNKNNEENKNKLIAALLTGINRAYPFSSLPANVFENYLNDLFKATHLGNFNTSIQAMTFLYHLSSAPAKDAKEKDETSGNESSINNRFYRNLYELIFDRRLESTSKQTLFFNLLYKALLADKSTDRIAAFLKRIFQVSAMLMKPSFICASFILLNALLKAKPELALLFDDKSTDQQRQSIYDGKKRDPLYASAMSSFLWEILPLLSHYHPSVSTYAMTLKAGSFLDSLTDSNTKLNPFTAFSLTSFLDRFIKKKPKAQKILSVMQPTVLDNLESMPSLENEDFYVEFLQSAKGQKSKTATVKKPKIDEENFEDEVDKFLNQKVNKSCSEDEDISDFDESDGSDTDENGEKVDFEGMISIDDADEEEENHLIEAESDLQSFDEGSDDSQNSSLDVISSDEDDRGFFSDKDNDTPSKPPPNKTKAKTKVKHIENDSISTESKKRKRCGWQKRAKELGINTTGTFFDADALEALNDE